MTADDIANRQYAPTDQNQTSSSATPANNDSPISCSGKSACSELYFCDADWPAFREVDFLRAPRNYAGRRRYGG